MNDDETLYVDEKRFPYIGEPVIYVDETQKQEHISHRVDMDGVGMVTVRSSHYIDNDRWWWGWSWDGLKDGAQPKGCRYLNSNANPSCPSAESARDVARADAVKDYLERVP